MINWPKWISQDLSLIMTFIPFILFSDIYNIYRSQLPLYITYYPEEAFGQSSSVVQLFFLTNFSSLLFTYIMSNVMVDTAIHQLLSFSSEVKSRRSWHRQLKNQEKKLIIQLLLSIHQTKQLQRPKLIASHITLSKTKS